MFSRYKGECLTLAAFLIWGLMPLYFSQLSEYPAHTIFAVRVITSIPLLFFVGFHFLKNKQSLPTLKNIGWSLAGAALISTSWYFNLWGTINGQLVAVSLAFFLSPIFTVVAAMLIFKEKLSKKQWATFALCILAVAGYAIASGELPWLTLVIASCFAGYGVVKRKGQITELGSLTSEVVLMLPIALFILLGGDNPVGFFWVEDTTLLFIAPAYFLPLVLFGIGVRMVKQLVTVGMLNYIEPVAMYVLALTLFQEPVSAAKQITMIVIWIAIAISIPFDQLKRKQTPSEVLASV